LKMVSTMPSANPNQVMPAAMAYTRRDVIPQA
jgi:hypothetical protein